MYNNLQKYFFPSNNQQSTTIIPSFDTRIDIECKEFLPQVYDTWSYIHKLSTDTTYFREIYDLYKYERLESQQKFYFDQLKIFDDKIYKLSSTIHQRIQSLEKLIQPILDEFHNNQQINNYTPAYIRIVENQLNSLKLSFKRIIIKHNSDSIDYQNNLKQSVENSKIIINSYQDISRLTINKIKNLFNTDQSQEQIQLQIVDEKQQQNLTEQEKQIIDLETRLESVRILKERVRQMK